MQLSLLSKSLVAAALALGSPLLDATAEAAPHAATATTPSTSWHFVQLDQLLAKLVPAPANSVGVYRWTGGGPQALRGAAFYTTCPRRTARCRAVVTESPPGTQRLLAVSQTGALQWLGWDAFVPVRAALAGRAGQDASAAVELAALDHLLADPRALLDSGTTYVWVEQHAQGARVIEDPLSTQLLSIFYGPPRLATHRARLRGPNDHVRAQREHARWRAALAARTTTLGTAFPPAAQVTTIALDKRYRAQLGKGLYELDLTSPQVAALPAHERAVLRVVRATPQALDGWVAWAPVVGGQVVGVLHTSFGCSMGRGMPPGMVPSVSVVIGTKLIPIAAYTDDQVHPQQCHPHGRRPPGLVAPHRAPADPRGAFLADAAHLEAASVPAFERLAAELARLGAPARLVDRTRAAAADEVRHAAIMTAHAVAAGAVPATVEVTPTPLRDAFALALDNAVEGCVHEAFAAVLCRFQAVTCRDLALAADLDVIAEDEARHGELAWAIARWLEPQLTADQRAVVERARATAVAALGERTARQLAPFAMAAAPLGMPSGAQGRVLADGFAAALAA